jgi:tRNA threonylcarbamoyladenosine biosynthesis protein TsaB
MRVIALDSTTRAGSVALVDNGRIVDERSGDPSRSHAERLPMEIVALAHAHRVVLGDVDLFAVASGPGSFTGLRIGIATMQGLAFVHRRRVFAVSVLEALAHAATAASAPGSIVGVWMDAHRRDVFSAAYRVGSGKPFTTARVEEIDAPAVDEPAAIVSRWRGELPDAPAVVVGDGAELFRREILDAFPDAIVVAAPPVAGTIGLLASTRPDEAIAPAAIRPLYVRRPDAELARDRQS